MVLQVTQRYLRILSPAAKRDWYSKSLSVLGRKGRNAFLMSPESADVSSFFMKLDSLQEKQHAAMNVKSSGMKPTFGAASISLPNEH